MLQVQVNSTVRTVFGKGPMRQLRMRDITPGNMYSGGKTPVSLQFNTAQLYKDLLSIQGRNAVITLQIEGDDAGERHVLVQEIQKDSVTGDLIHIDFFEIDLQEAATFTVPVKYVGTAKGVDLGGELHIFKTNVRLKGRPLDIPDLVEVDITHLEQGGQGLAYSDFSIPPNVEMMEKGNVTCVAVL
ncbi:50S ribosomal protein L25 [Desulfobulbus oligotrophicus]|jgi:large subunit ribosomal protein L25|uniref:Large ribosomal subunit protein bL25 n=1 Tax=Desulfobulbus oligotrophicus TaxID=1909699 RepID=A0A7T5VAT4_9BACT|nr:50S ribosomal protein L25 [Desulfobulbus oligotrophicus]MDY0391569.1 50S ribosomal protein L25 [Desulfobulbus oligotrophicus]QQG64376.1 50S ribosomal protein L25 [Desulfobulbus oligotrophicus]